MSFSDVIVSSFQTGGAAGEGPADSEAALQLASSTLRGLPIGAFLPFSSFLEQKRLGDSIRVDLDTFVDYLKRETGISDDLVAIVETSAADC